MKQENRVQLSFPSIVKIFGIYGIGLELFFIGFYLIHNLAGFQVANVEPVEFFMTILLLPVVTIIMAVVGYPFFALINRFRGGGLILTVVKFKGVSNVENNKKT
jgi:hypothetical protein